MTGSLPQSIEALKDQAKRLRTALASDGAIISHSRSLELLAHHYGYKDWNSLRALVVKAAPPCPTPPGRRVSGRYLGQAFRGEVIAVHRLTPPDRFRITLSFDQPVDVVTFASFSNLRRRVSCVIDRKGRTIEKTSDGRPHLQLEL